MNDIEREQDNPLVRCPRCGFVMRMVHSESAPSGQKNLTYKCHECSTKTDRHVPSRQFKQRGSLCCGGRI